MCCSSIKTSWLNLKGQVKEWKYKCISDWETNPNFYKSSQHPGFTLNFVHLFFRVLLVSLVPRGSIGRRIHGCCAWLGCDRGCEGPHPGPNGQTAVPGSSWWEIRASVDQLTSPWSCTLDGAPIYICNIHIWHDMYIYKFFSIFPPPILASPLSRHILHTCSHSLTPAHAATIHYGKHHVWMSCKVIPYRDRLSDRLPNP